MLTGCAVGAPSGKSHQPACKLHFSKQLKRNDLLRLKT